MRVRQPKRVQAESIIRAILKPLADLCIQRGVRCSAVEELVRETFVARAEEAIRLAEGETSASKVSIMTGLHRTEVTRLLRGEQSDGGKVDVATRVIGLWSESKKYLNRNGTPRSLTFQGTGSEFALLVATVTKEMTHYPILFELERIGAIEYSNELVTLTAKEYTPPGNLTHGLELLSTDVQDLTTAIEANLTERNETPSLHLRTSFDNVSPSKLEEIRSWVLKRGAEFQNDVRGYLSSFDRDINPDLPGSEERAQVSVTVFSSAEPIESIKQVKPKKRGRKKGVS